MIQSGNWKQIETLLERPGVAVMTSGGYWLDGRFYPTHRAVPAQSPMPQPKRSLFDWIWR
ncbi:hypothetical protein [Sphingopyxis sp. 22461]|uniref:hypothetical protein n=1 Tax=Sphingopyxis sp. 22461 TaxID=3453923 RepID=UPI003F83F897